MKRIIYIAGVPASGKTTILNNIRKELFQEAEPFAHGKCKGIRTPDGLFEMLGVFDGSPFEGTDKLAMTVINDAIDYYKSNAETPGTTVVFAEGDRLFNERFLTTTRASLVMVDATPDVLAARHKERGDTQTEKFLKGRRSKLENFAAKFHVRRLWNIDMDDSRRITKSLVKLAKEWAR